MNSFAPPRSLCGPTWFRPPLAGSASPHDEPDTQDPHHGSAHPWHWSIVDALTTSAVAVAQLTVRVRAGHPRPAAWNCHPLPCRTRRRHSSRRHSRAHHTHQPRHLRYRHRPPRHRQPQGGLRRPTQPSRRGPPPVGGGHGPHHRTLHHQSPDLARAPRHLRLHRARWRLRRSPDLLVLPPPLRLGHRPRVEHRHLWRRPRPGSMRLEQPGRRRRREARLLPLP